MRKQRLTPYILPSLLALFVCGYTIANSATVLPEGDEPGIDLKEMPNLKEHAIVPSLGFSGTKGIAKFWVNSVFANGDQRVIYQTATRAGRVQFFGSTEQNWRQDQYTALVIYYLNYHPGRSNFNLLDKRYTDSRSNGIAVDLGEPAKKIPDGYEPIPLMFATQTPFPTDYTVVGDSTMGKVTHPDLPNGVTHLLPTYTYFLRRSERSIVSGGPEEMVLAREFSKGRVLYRTDFFGGIPAFYNSQKLRIKLDVPMRPVDSHGNIGDYVREVEIGGYEGLFLLY